MDNELIIKEGYKVVEVVDSRIPGEQHIKLTSGGFHASTQGANEEILELGKQQDNFTTKLYLYIPAREVTHNITINEKDSESLL